MTGTAPANAGALDGGFADPARDAAHAFRALMTAMARPGEIVSVQCVAPPAPLGVAAGGAVLTLCDPDTPLALAPALDRPDIRRWLAFHSGAPLVAPEAAAFAIGPWADLAGQDFTIGTADYPDRSATLIAEVGTLAATGARLTGPGIEDIARLSLPDLDFFRRNNALFPMGVDVILTCGARLAAVPRSTRVAEGD